MATLDLKSFTVKIRASGPPDVGPADGMDTYVAPDKLRSVSNGADGDEIIRIGKTIYVSHPERPGHYHRQPVAEEGTSKTFFPHLAGLLQAEDVAEKGGVFTFASPPGDGEARVSRGLVVSLAIRERLGGDDFVTTYTFAMFNAAPPIERPPEERIVPIEGLPPCDDFDRNPPRSGSDPGIFICDPEA